MEQIKNEVLLEVRDLTVTRYSAAGPVVPANHLNITLHRGETLGIVGESGSGKSTTAYAIMQLLEQQAQYSGEILLEGSNLLSFTEKELRRIRGRKIGMIFQEPMKCLDPLFRVGKLLREALLSHENLSRAEADRRCREMLLRVGFTDPDTVLKSYPFELSGGMCQRVMIAMILLLSPELIIADEPTTALDVTIQDGIIGLLRKICREDGKTLFFITHNFGLVAELCDRVCVMYGGSIVESGSVEDIFYHPAHPYTKGLLTAIPRTEFSGKQTLVPVAGTPVDLANLPSGCAFHPRCPHCTELCRTQAPEERELGGGHSVKCWFRADEGEKADE